MSKTVTVMVVSDIHAGHEIGMYPPGMLGLTGERHNLNAGQRFLWKAWLDLVAWRKKMRPDVIIVNGDFIDGEQRKNVGTEAQTTICAAQQKAAVRILEPLVDGCKQIYCIRGSPYHDGRRGLDIEPIAEELGAIGPHKDWHTHGVLDLDIDGVNLNVMHQIGSMSGSYRFTALDKEGLWAVSRGKEGSVPKADCIIRSHLHFYGHIETPRHHVVISPAWQLQTEYMRRHSAYRMIPDIGALLIHVDPAAKKAGLDPIRIEKRLYQLPAVKSIKANLR